MKKRLLLASAIVSALLVESVSALCIEDYKVIEGTYQDAYLNGSLNVKNGNQDKTSFNSHIDAKSRYIYNTAPFSWQINGVVAGDWSRGGSENDPILRHIMQQLILDLIDIFTMTIHGFTMEVLI